MSHRILAWLKVAVAFGVASAAQIFVYGGPRLWGSSEPWFNVPGQLYTLLVLCFFFGPALIAALLSLHILRAYYRRQRLSLPKRVVAVVGGLGFLSSYLGVVICFNVWGT